MTDSSVKIYVGNHSFDTTEDSLREMFAEYGDIVSVDMIKDRETGAPRGFSFITIAGADAAAKAVEGLNGRDVDGRQIKVNIAEERSRNRASGGGRSSNTGRSNFY